MRTTEIAGSLSGLELITELEAAKHTEINTSLLKTNKTLKNLMLRMTASDQTFGFTSDVSNIIYQKNFLKPSWSSVSADCYQPHLRIYSGHLLNPTESVGSQTIKEHISSFNFFFFPQKMKNNRQVCWGLLFGWLGLVFFLLLLFYVYSFPCCAWSCMWKTALKNQIIKNSFKICFELGRLHFLWYSTQVASLYLYEKRNTWKTTCITFHQKLCYLLSSFSNRITMLSAPQLLRALIRLQQISKTALPIVHKNQAELHTAEGWIVQSTDQFWQEKKQT